MADRADRDLFSVADERVDREQAHNLSLVRFEETVVGRLLKFHGLESRGPELRARCRSLTGRAHLLFIHFLDEYPTFPVFAVFDKITYLHDLTVEDWVRRFTKTEVFKRYEVARPLALARDEAKPLALIFPTFNFGGVMIVHTTPAGMRPGCRRMSAAVDDSVYTFEPLEDFLATQRWVP